MPSSKHTKSLITPFNRLPKRAKDITGQRFGRLLAIKPVGQDPFKEVIWKFACDCGEVALINGSSERRRAEALELRGYKQQRRK